MAVRSAAARPGTETAKALAAMTPRSRALFPAGLLRQRIGRGTVAGALNDQIRFRLQGSGPLSRRRFVPDNELSARLLASPAGPALIRQLHTAAASADQLSDHTNLDGFMLNRSSETVAAGNLMANLEGGRPYARAVADRAALDSPTNPVDVGPDLRTSAKTVRSWIPTAGAWARDGWIQMMPDFSRALLNAAGAYRPGEGDDSHSRHSAQYLNSVPTHEVQHLVTEATVKAYGSPAKWMEEGIAELFARTPGMLAKTVKATGITPAVWLDMATREPVFDTGWGAWKRPTLSQRASTVQKANVERNYSRPQDILREFVKMSGGDFRSKAGLARAYDVLQGKSLRFVPGSIADAIIEHNHLNPAVRERLRGRIANAVDEPHAIANIRRDFGIPE